MSTDELPQRIDPEKLNMDPNKPGFGYTISKVGSKRKLDVDGNKCNDFAVGYPQSNKVVLLRSKEVVKLQAKSPHRAIRLEPSAKKVPEDCPSLSGSCSINPPYPPDISKYFFRSMSKVILYTRQIGMLYRILLFIY